MSDTVTIWIITLWLFFLAAVPLVLGMRRAVSIDIWEPIYPASLYFILIFPIRSFYALVEGTAFLGEAPFSPELLEAWLFAAIFAALGFIAFLLGYFSRLGKALAGTIAPLPSVWDLFRLRLAILTLTVVGMGALGTLVSYTGGPSVYLMNKHLSLSAPGTTYLYSLFTCLSLASILAYILCAIYRGGMLTLGLLLPVTLVAGISTGARGFVLYPILGLLIVRHYLIRRTNFWQVGLMIFLIIIIMPIFNVYRQTANFDQIVAESIQAYSRFSLLVEHLLNRFHGMDAFIYAVRDTPNTMEFQLGATLLPVVVAWIPRFVWDEKPIVSFAKVFAETYWDQWFAGTGVAPSVTLFGEAYINFHLAGVLIAGWISGVALRLIYHYLVNRSFGTSGVFIYAVMAPYLITFFESDIGGLMSRATFIYFLALATVFFVAKVSRKYAHTCAY